MKKCSRQRENLVYDHMSVLSLSNVVMNYDEILCDYEVDA